MKKMSRVSYETWNCEIQEHFKNKSLKNSLFQGFFIKHLQFKNNSRNSRNSRTTGHPVFPSFSHFSDSKEQIEVE